ncbi:MAG: glycosyl hydrolase, partial [Acidobacteriaceae bacterium]|nr:glycosyl hydrolase [Acidobacteriaceae bacterium]
FGLWISIDGGKEWAQYKGNDFPAVAVRDLVVQPRDSALVIATHGRGIWVVDDISPLREMTPDLMAKDAAFIKARPQQQRLTAFGGWAEGDAMYVGPNPPDAALITYYQKKRHIFGRMKIEIVDRQGKLVDTLPANSRRGLTRLEWSMRLKPPRVPTAATIAGEATEGLRVLPGKYTVKMTRGKEAYTTPLDLTLDRRAKFTVEDRKMQYEAVLRLYKLFRDMSFDVDQINGVHQALLMRASQAKTDDALETKLRDATAKDEAIRKKIVATQEGGAITGEERIREKTSQVYGALNSYEGRPADYYIGRIDSLSRELGDVMREFETFTAKDLQDTNAALEKKSLKPVTPMTRAQWDGANSESGMSANARGRLVSKLAIFGR